MCSTEAMTLAVSDQISVTVTVIVAEGMEPTRSSGLEQRSPGALIRAAFSEMRFLKVSDVLLRLPEVREFSAGASR